MYISDIFFVKENLGIFAQIGFQVVEKDAPKDAENHISDFGQKLLYLKSVPVIHGFQYGIQDFYDVLEILKHKPEKKTVLLPRMLKDLATKACRSAIMIGTKLSYPEMTQVVRKMKDMQSPWYCPHGRPSTVVSPKRNAPNFGNLSDSMKFNF